LLGTNGQLKLSNNNTCIDIPLGAHISIFDPFIASTSTNPATGNPAGYYYNGFLFQSVSLSMDGGVTFPVAVGNAGAMPFQNTMVTWDSSQNAWLDPSGGPVGTAANRNATTMRVCGQSGQTVMALSRQDVLMV
jgi:hypothetical protein